MPCGASLETDNHGWFRRARNPALLGFDADITAFCEERGGTCAGLRHICRPLVGPHYILLPRVTPATESGVRGLFSI